GTGTGTGTGTSTADDGSDYPAAAQGTISYQIDGGAKVVKNGPSVTSLDPSIFSDKGSTLISYINGNATDIFQLSASTLAAGTYDITAMNVNIDASFLSGKVKFTVLNHSSNIKGNAVGTFKAQLENFSTGATHTIVGSFNVKG
ncbi:MAG: hypothetical protein JWQ57_5182, partial [Mucilaginibacter sp.]|nr:hypothetical protein [Mucilaginibacter sp.]